MSKKTSYKVVGEKESKCDKACWVFVGVITVCLLGLMIWTIVDVSTGRFPRIATEEYVDDRVVALGLADTQLGTQVNATILSNALRFASVVDLQTQQNNTLSGLINSASASLKTTISGVWGNATVWTNPTARTITVTRSNNVVTITVAGYSQLLSGTSGSQVIICSASLTAAYWPTTNAYGIAQIFNFANNVWAYETGSVLVSTAGQITITRRQGPWSSEPSANIIGFESFTMSWVQ